MSTEFIKRIISSIILLPLTFFIIIKGSFLFILFILICLLISIYEWNKITKDKRYKIFGFIFLFFSFLSIYNLRLNSGDNYSFFLLIITVCISTDIGGYIFGKLFKGPKLIKYSPNKTYAGLIGAFVFSIISMILFSYKFQLIELSGKLLIFTLVISLISQLGDIFISYFKRLSNIKDTGKIIPGHGGLLDRIDGMIFVFPFSNIIILTNFFNV
jgi:phosphatidate cytidylyltransferase